MSPIVIFSFYAIIIKKKKKKNESLQFRLFIERARRATQRLHPAGTMLETTALGALLKTPICGRLRAF